MNPLCYNSGLDFLANTRGVIGVKTGRRKDAPEKFSDHLALCRLCTMRDECLAIAIRYDEPSGIWGGTFPHERRTL